MLAARRGLIMKSINYRGYMFFARSSIFKAIHPIVSELPPARAPQFSRVTKKICSGVATGASHANLEGSCQ
jgi:hypothetical protein